MGCFGSGRVCTGFLAPSYGCLNTLGPPLDRPGARRRGGSARGRGCHAAPQLLQARSRLSPVDAAEQRPLWADASRASGQMPRRGLEGCAEHRGLRVLLGKQGLGWGGCQRENAGAGGFRVPGIISGMPMAARRCSGRTFPGGGCFGQDHYGTAGALEGCGGGAAPQAGARAP